MLVEIAAEAFDESSLTGDVAASEVRDRFQARLVACFRRGLAAGAAPTAAIALSLTVGETGAVTSPRATPSGELGDCVMASARVWRFDVPRDADGEPTETSLRFSITFTPGP